MEGKGSLVALWQLRRGEIGEVNAIDAAEESKRTIDEYCYHVVVQKLYVKLLVVEACVTTQLCRLTI